MPQPWLVRAVLGKDQATIVIKRLVAQRKDAGILRKTIKNCLHQEDLRPVKDPGRQHVLSVLSQPATWQDPAAPRDQYRGNL
ncbi:unnamed protein product [Durusdinium trenchii]|uniref:Uncharacterized protein n=1 Tax=Durusdinium trenchii TaxID=1381693 RepID=A0ABP0Q4E8_9DINO